MVIKVVEKNRETVKVCLKIDRGGNGIHDVYILLDEFNENFTNIYPAFPYFGTHKGELRQCLRLSKLEDKDEYHYPFEEITGKIITSEFVAIKILDREAMPGWGNCSNGEFYRSNCPEKPLQEIQALQFFNGINNTFPDHFKQHLIKGIGCVADRGRVYSILPFLGRDCDFFDTFQLSNGNFNDNFDRDLIKKVFYGAVKSVYMMHGLGCTHRDLSLENICLDLFGNAVVIDLGAMIRYPIDPITGAICYCNNITVGKKHYYPFEYVYNKDPDNEYSPRK